MTDPIGKRIDALQGRIAGLQSRLETVQRELNEVALEYVRNARYEQVEDAIDRVLLMADLMDKAPDALTRAWARRVRNAVTGGSDG